MLDATSRTPSGLLSYNIGDMGYFDQCLAIISKYSSVKGKYCLGYISQKKDNTSESNDVLYFNEQVRF